MCYNESRCFKGGFAYEYVGADIVIIRPGFIDMKSLEAFFSQLIPTVPLLLFVRHTVLCCFLFFTLSVVKFQDV